MGNGSGRTGRKFLKCCAIEGTEGEEAKVRVLGIEDGCILQEHDAKPLHNRQELPERNVLVAGILLGSDVECSLLIFDHGKICLRSSVGGS